MAVFKAKNPENQPLIDALYEMGEVETHSNAKNAGFRGRALRTAAQNLADLEEKITNGDELTAGPKKVPGVGKRTGYYIDEFLETGKIAEIEERKANTEEQEEEQEATAGQKRKDPSGKKSDEDQDKDEDKEPEMKDEDDPNIKINRAPVLTLWATAVAERQGFSHEEALTYGRWISTMFAQAKGQSLGKFQKRTKTKKAKTLSQMADKEHVDIFENVDIPVKEVGGKLLALERGHGTIDPDNVENYLKRSFGSQDLELARDAMRELASSMDPDELRAKAYDMYQEIRPEWHGWGKPGSLSIGKVHELESKNEKTL